MQQVGSQHGFNITVVHGFARGKRAERLNTGELGGAVTVRNRYVALPGGRSLVWQPIIGRAWNADLVVVEQANRHLVNPLLLAGRLVGGPLVAYWGHGRNLQSGGPSLSERVKEHTLNAPDHWFAYTQGVRTYLVDRGVAQSKVTVVGNAIDVTALRADIDRVRSSGVTRNLARCTFLGGLHRHKRLEILFRAADELAQSVAGFELVIAGDGELRAEVESYVATRPWAQYAGQVHGRERARLLATSGALLMPGLVGLVILDAFAAGIPLVSMARSLHSPEIEYLQDGVNGILVKHDDASSYAASVRHLLEDRSAMARLSEGAYASADDHDASSAANSFVLGLKAASQRSRRPTPLTRCCRQARRRAP
jgi:glycosyltransferase involved in cell wall biosynthesis